MSRSTLMPSVLDATVRLFENHFGTAPAAAAHAPGRVEVIGNHTDYNGGMVIGAGIDRGIVAVGSLRTDRTIRLVSGGGTSAVEWHRSDRAPRQDGARWTNYPIGVLLMLEQEGLRLETGFDIAFESDIPSGAGLSSSAALELATAELLLQLADQRMDPLTLVRACRRAENEFVGVPCGILDQGVSKFSRADHVVSIDCREEVFSTLPLPEGTHFWIFNSHQRHALLGSLYETRHRECMEATEVLRSIDDRIRYLTDATVEQVEAAREALGPERYRRALHVTSEHARVGHALNALRTGDSDELGRLLYASHESSRDLFENSTAELDFLVERLREQPHVIGARLTGGGFGGAVLSVTGEGFGEREASVVSDAYFGAFGSGVGVVHCRTSQGAGPVTLPASEASPHT